LFLWLYWNGFPRDDVANTLRILVATDCHLGFMEKDEIRRHDSFQAFEETCSIAEQKKVILFACAIDLLLWCACWFESSCYILYI
jgi:hypothetical protein